MITLPNYNHIKALLIQVVVGMALNEDNDKRKKSALYHNLYIQASKFPLS